MNKEIKFEKSSSRKNKLNKVLVFVFVIAVTFGIAFLKINNDAKKASAATSFLTGEVCYVNATNLNVRTGPGTNYSVAGTLPKTAIIICGPSSKGNWQSIFAGTSSGSNAMLYVYKDYITSLGGTIYDNVSSTKTGLLSVTASKTSTKLISESSSSPSSAKYLTSGIECATLPHLPTLYGTSYIPILAYNESVVIGANSPQPRYGFYHSLGNGYVYKSGYWGFFHDFTNNSSAYGYKINPNCHY